MNKKLLLKWLTALMLVFFLGACQSNEGGKEENNEEPNTEQAAEDSGSYTVTDDLGKEITFDAVPETVVSLQPSNTEILFELGVGDKIIGATEYDTYPEEAQDIERVSDTMNIDAEKIIELNPDVIIAYTIGDPESLKPLEDAGLAVFTIQSASSFDDVYGDIVQIAEVMGVKEKGEEIVDNIRAQVEELENKLAEVDEAKRLYFEVSPAPEIYSVGNNTFQQEILAKAGVENVFEDEEGWINVSEEEVIKRDPELIVTTVNYVDEPVAEIKGRTGWDQIKAVQNDNVHLLDADTMDRPGPRIGQAVELIAKTAYPELFE